MLHAEDPVDLRTGDQLVCQTVIRRGDIVAFQRVAPREVAWGTLLPGAQAAWTGFLYRVDNDEAGRTVFVPIRTGRAERQVGDAQRSAMEAEPPEAPPGDA